MRMQSKLLIAAGLMAAHVAAQAADPTLIQNWFLNQTIPDNNLSGVVSPVTVSFPGMNAITDLQVQLNVSGDFTGDLYAWLQHDTGFAVLLNRPGRTATSTFGYNDPGLFITLDDNGSDVHLYRTQFPSNPNAPIPLTGVWAPDGRNVSPLIVTDTDPRTATLSAFNGLDPNGAWSLFVADTSGGGVHNLVSWSLIITAVPEPGTWAMLVLGLALFAWSRRR